MEADLRAHALAWLAKARQNLDRVARCLAAKPSDTEDALFHCQQAAEKALKALLARHDEPFRKTHDLSALGKQCAALEPELASLLERLDDLTEYAWVFRYPGEFTLPPAEPEIEAAAGLARQIVLEAALRIESNS